ncbi:Potassium transporter [Heracleum sosnowskyi]|uniref:Potassium transporter n=1 Tax=Heracleum sosnowskyi TaxID=360622 RepID=A0AAD8HS70_9APIA|nr:Potassium transporter [Heracleum sosnowskyi]
MADQSSDTVEANASATVTDTNQNLKGRKMSWAKLRRVDSLNMEAGKVSFTSNHTGHSQASWGRTLSLAFQCLGVIYGDVGTSPLYVYSSTFTDGIKDNQDLLGVLSLIIYTLLLSPLIKYSFIVLRANDNGNGGTFALYSLISRHANMRLVPNNQPEDKELSNYRLNTPSSQLQRAEKIKNKLSKSMPAKIMLVLVTILGCSMVIGDGILTPSISVLSAVGGIKNKVDSLDQNAVVGISIAILVILFSAQRFGSDRVGYTFAPIIIVWFAFIGGIGFYNLFKHDITVLRAFNPKYIIDYFKRNGSKGWKSLGGVVMCITGTEAMFADIGHFNVLAVQLSFTSVVLPALLSTYIGQAAYLSKNPKDVADTFYASIPGKYFNSNHIL